MNVISINTCGVCWLRTMDKMHRYVHHRVMSICGIVLFAVISANHRAIGFLGPINSPSYSSKESRFGCKSSCWSNVETRREDHIIAFSQTENDAHEGAVDASASVIPQRRKRRISVAASENFEKRFVELVAFKDIHGHTRVPRRQGKLGDWVNKLRQRKDRLDEQRLRRLNEIGFCWDASGDKLRKEQERWWERLESLRMIQEQNQLSVLSHDKLTSSEKKWLRRQQLQFLDSGRKPSLRLNERQIQALIEIDSKWWQTVRISWWCGWCTFGEIAFSLRSKAIHVKVQLLTLTDAIFILKG